MRSLDRNLPLPASASRRFARGPSQVLLFLASLDAVFSRSKETLTLPCHVRFPSHVFTVLTSFRVPRLLRPRDFPWSPSAFPCCCCVSREACAHLASSLPTLVREAGDACRRPSHHTSHQAGAPHAAPRRALPRTGRALPSPWPWRVGPRQIASHLARRAASTARRGHQRCR